MTDFFFTNKLYFKLFLFGIALIVFAAMINVYAENREVMRPAAKSELVVLTKKSHFTVDADEYGRPKGLEFERIQSFSKMAGLTAKFVYKENDDEIWADLRDGKADMVASRSSPPSKNAGDYYIGPKFEESNYSLICKLLSKNEKPEDLKGRKILLLKNQDGIEFTKEFKGASFENHKDDNPYFLLRRIALKEANCAILETQIAKFYVRFFSSLAIKLEVDVPLKVTWYLNRGEINRLAHQWGRKAQKSGELLEIYSSNVGHLGKVDVFEARQFFRGLKSTFPQYEKIFKKAARETRLSWKLLAALSFQESHWNQKARSYTGVRGLMMLTDETAELMNVENRRDPQQSVLGGARFLKMLIDKQPENLGPHERIRLALAAYNVGIGHLKDAMSLAEKMNRKPHSWVNLKSVFPLLSSEDYYTQTQFGYARGHEPIRFVDRVLNFYELIVEKERLQASL